MAAPVHAINNNDEWRREKLDFICSVVTNVDRESLLNELGFCETDEDAEGLLQSLIMRQDEEENQPNGDLPMGDPVHAINNNDEWRREKLDFICSVVTNVDRESLLNELSLCETDEDAEGLMQSLILLQDEEFLTQNDLPLQQQRLNVYYPQDIVIHIPEEHEEEPIAQALAENLTIECGICFEKSRIDINTNSCSALRNEHIYCNNCIKRYVETQIGQGLTRFKCMEGYCDAEFSIRMLQRLINPTVFAKICERRQQEEITAAGVENLEYCPFCNYMVSMPNKEDKVFKCWNRECMIDSCRKCKEPNHIPLRCEEVEKKGQRNARTFLENEMAEAMIRECPRCNKRFIIESGCNTMTCLCGAVMCYVCKQLIDTRYGNHFANGECPTQSNLTTLHEEEVRKAAQRAKRELDPDVTLVHDPTTFIL